MPVQLYDYLLSAVCAAFETSPSEVMAAYKRRSTRARQAYWYLLRQDRHMELQDIQKALPKRFGFTAIHYGIHTVANVLEVDHEYASRIEQARIGAKAIQEHEKFKTT